MVAGQMSAIKKITIDDLQSVKNLELNFEKSGVFRLDGNNDIGKSAILRGISALFQNVSNRNYKEYISDWAESFVVTADFYDGSFVELSRGAVDYYEWSLPSGSGRADKTKGKVPDPVAEYFNLYSEQEKTNLVLNFNLPGDTLPFVDTSTLDNYWLMQKALGTEDFLIGTRMLNRRVSDTRKEIKVIFEIVEKQQEKLDNITNEIKNDTNKKNPLDRFASIMKVEHAALLEMYALEKEEIDILRLKDKLASLITIPADKLDALEKEGSVLKHMEKAATLENEIKGLDTKLTTVTEVLKNDFDTSHLVSELKAIADAEKVVLLETQLNTLVDRKESVVKKESSLAELVEVKTLLDSIKSSQQSYMEIKSIDEKQKAVEEIQKVVEEKATQLVNLDLEIEKLKVELGECPFCGSDLTSPNHNHNKGVNV